MYKLFEIGAGEDLAPFAAFLWRHRIPHRVLPRGSMQELWLARPEDAEFVLERFNHWQRGGALESAEARPPARPPALGVRFWLLHTPVTMALIVLSLGLTLLSAFGDDLGWLHWFTFVDFNFQGQQLLSQSLDTLLAGGEYWRLVTPIFLHFSLLHLVFNLLWTWELGRRIELMQPRWLLLCLVLLTGVGSNIGQYWVTGPLFGGLSGVIFGLIGYIWLWDRLNPDRNFGLPPSLMTFMLIWLVLGASGALEAMGFGSIANMAHLVGLLCGLAAAPVAHLYRHRLWTPPG